MREVVISGTGLFAPPHKFSNDELVQAFNNYVDQCNTENEAVIESGATMTLVYYSSEFIEKASRIKQRCVMNKAGVLNPLRMCPRLPQRSDDQPSHLCEMTASAACEALAQAGKKASDIDLAIVACSSATFGSQAASDVIVCLRVSSWPNSLTSS